MYVATQHREDANLFYVTPVNENGEADPAGTFAIRLDDPNWFVGLDELTKAAVQQAIDDARRQIVDPKTEQKEDRVEPPQQPRGKSAFDMQFKSYSPTGFKASGGFGTQGGAWDSYSPSGWNSDGGWSINPGPSPMYNYMQQGYSKDDAIRLMAGMQPLQAIQQQVAETQQLITQNAVDQMIYGGSKPFAGGTNPMDDWLAKNTVTR